MTIALRSQVPTAASTPAEMITGPAQQTTTATAARTVSPAPARLESPIRCPPLSLGPVGTDPATRHQVRAVLVGELASVFQDASHAPVGDAVRHLAAGALGLDEAAPPQTGKMVRHLALTDPECVDELRDRSGTIEQQLEDGQSGRVAQDPKEASRRNVEIRILDCCDGNHVASIQQEILMLARKERRWRLGSVRSNSQGPCVTTRSLPCSAARRSPSGRSPTDGRCRLRPCRRPWISSSLPARPRSSATARSSGRTASPPTRRATRV